MTVTQFNVYPCLSPARVVAASNQSGTYNNGPINNGVKATFTYATGALTIDSVAVLVNDRVLLVGQTNGNENGIYVCTVQGATGVAAVLTRAGDLQCSEQVLLGSYISVSAGTVHGGASYTLVEPRPATFGVDDLLFNATITSGLGTAATKGASDDAEPTVASVSGATTVDGIATYADTAGTVKDDSTYSISDDILRQSYEGAITAHAGGGKASAYQLTKAINKIATVATDGDSVKLPPAIPGTQVWVNNINATHYVDVFPNGTDTINALSTTLAIRLLPEYTIMFDCTVTGNWSSAVIVQNFPAPTLIPFSPSLTAHAGGGKADALQLVAVINTVSTVATAGDSVKLPPAVPGTQVTINNLAVRPIQVFGNGTDTINLVATATGISQPFESSYIYTCTTAGNWFTGTMTYNYPVLLNRYAGSLTAFSGGGQASALQLTAEINAITTVAAAGDSVKLPPSLPGLRVQVTNLNVNNSVQVYGNGTDTINTVATGTGVPLLPDQTAIYTCTTAGNWYSNYYPVNQQAVLVASVPISAAEFNGMYAAPKLLVAAPGANRLLVLDKVELLMTYGTANYADGGVAAVQYDSTALGAGVIASTTLSAATFQAAASTGFMFNTGVVPQTFSTTVNKGLYLSNITGAFTTGDSTFVAKVFYKIVATA